MTHKLTRRSVAKGIALSAGALAFPAIGRAQAQSVKIAMIAPMSGPWARQGQLLRMGADLAIEDINARGGIKIAWRRQAEYYLRRCRRQHRKGQERGATPGRDNPDLVGGTGSWLSSFTLAVTEVTERAQIPWLTLSYSDAITNRGFKFVFQTSPTAEWQAATNCADRSRHGANRHRQAADHHWLDHGQYRLTDQFCQAAA